MTMMRMMMMMMRMMAVVLAAAVVTMLRSFMTIGSTARMTKTHPECAWTSKAHSACTKRAVWEPSCFPKSAEPSPVDPVWVWVNWLPKTWMLWYALICLGLSLYLFQDFKWNPGRISSSGVRGANILFSSIDGTILKKNVKFGHIHNLEVTSPIFCSFTTPTHPPSPASSVWTCPAGPSAWVAHGSPGWGKSWDFQAIPPAWDDIH